MTLIAAAMGLAMVGIDGLAVSVANPRISATFHASLSGLQWVTDSYLLSLAVFLLIGGKFGDVYGHKRILLIGIIGFALASVVCGTTPSIGVLIADRTLQGAFAAMLIPQSLAVLRTSFPPDRLASAVGVWSAVASSATAIGPLVGGALIDALSWRWIFFVNVPVALIAETLCALYVRDSRDPRANRSLDVIGLGLMALGIFGIVFAVINSENAGWGSALSIDSMALGVVVVVLFVKWEARRGDRAALPLRLFTDRRIVVGGMSLGVVAMILFGVMFFLSLYYQRVVGLTPFAAGARTLPLTVSVMFSSPVAGRLVDRFGVRLPLALGMFGVGIAMGGLSRIGPATGYLDIWPWLILIGLCMGPVQTAASQAILGSAPRELAGVAGGLQGLVVQLGGVSGTALLGAVVSSRVGAIYLGRLVAIGVPHAVSERLSSQSELVAQGIVPTVTGVPSAVGHLMAEASSGSFCSGLDLVMRIGAILGLVAALCSATSMPSRPIPDELVDPLLAATKFAEIV